VSNIQFERSTLFVVALQISVFIADAIVYGNFCGFGRKYVAMGYESLSPRRPMHSSTALSSKYGAVNYVGTPSNLRRKDFLQVKGSIIFYVNLCERS